MHRERVGLSQADLSLLISVEQRASVSRYEQGLRFPNLETLLALEIVLGLPISDLFAGVTERVRENVSGRARALLEDLDDTPTKETLSKLDLLSKLAQPDEYRIIPPWEEN
jgi:transcriptional regulator with XRE-family HTH domain